MLLSELLRPDLIKVGIEATTPKETIAELVDLLVQQHEVSLAQRSAERHHAGIRRELLRVDDQLSDMLAFTGRPE